MFGNSTPSGSVVEPAQAPTGNNPAFPPAASGQGNPQPAGPVSSANMAAPEAESKSLTKIILIVSLVVVTIIAIIFAVLFINKFFEAKTISDDINSQIDSAVAVAVAQNTTKMENEFSEREKYPYRNFMGPVDYGSLSFEYPQTWSVYVAKDAAKGGDFEAYLNPAQVDPVANTTINALRVTIKDQAIDRVLGTYSNLVKNGKLQFSTRDVGGTSANIYVGALPNGNFQGIVAVFKLRDKTVVLQTDAMIFADQFYRILDTVNFQQ